MSSIPAYIRIAEQIKTECLQSREVDAGQKLPTQEELTARFGVSRSTIIRALSKLMAEGYIHSQQGSGVYATHSLPRDSATHQIGIIVPNLHATVIMAACRGVERRARQQGCQVLLSSSEFGIAHEQELVEQQVRAGVQGIVLYPVTRTQEQLEHDYLKHWSQPTPLVALDIGCEEWTCSRVQFDNYHLGYDMTQHLIRHKHRHIAFMHIQPSYLHTSILDREKGWKAAMHDAGMEIPDSYLTEPVPKTPGFVLPTPRFAPTQADYATFVADVLELRPRPDALIAWNDVVAAHLTQALNNSGVKVPEDMRVTGFDNDPLVTRLFRPLFPTSKPDFARLGELAVDTLADLAAQRWYGPRIYYYSVPALWREPHAPLASENLAPAWDEFDSAT